MKSATLPQGGRGRQSRQPGQHSSSGRPARDSEEHVGELKGGQDGGRQQLVPMRSDDCHGYQHTASIWPNCKRSKDGYFF